MKTSAAIGLQYTPMFIVRKKDQTRKREIKDQNMACTPMNPS